MDISELIKILKKLETKRDMSRNKFSGSKLVEQFYLVQINIFTSIYFTNIAEMGFKPTNLSELYQTYSRSRQSATRYLIELFLTFVHVLVLPEKDRFEKIYSFSLSERINMHKIDLRLGLILNNKDTRAKLEDNRSKYRDFIKTYGKINQNIPDEIDDFFSNLNDGILLDNLIKKFNFTYLKFNKLNYTKEIEENILITNHLRQALLLLYPLLSNETHPTITSLEDFEKFIMKDEKDKSKHLDERNEYFKSALRLLGEQMNIIIEKKLGL